MVWQAFNGVLANSCSYTNPNCVWVNSSQLFTNVTNSTSPIGALNQVFVKQLPWFWPLFPFVLYIYLLSVFSESQGRGKLFMIAAIVFIISAYLAIGGYIPDAIINFILFVAAFWLSGLFNKGGTTVGG